MDVYDDSDEEFGPANADEDDQDVADGGETLEGPQSVEFEPFPQDVSCELMRLQKEEEELARTFDYAPTSVDAQSHAVDQFGIRTQKTTMPPYIPLDDWVKMRGVAKKTVIDEFQIGAEKLKKMREKINGLMITRNDDYKRGGVRAVL